MGAKLKINLKQPNTTSNADSDKLFYFIDYVQYNKMTLSNIKE